jgi:hypothetical protein
LAGLCRWQCRRHRCLIFLCFQLSFAVNEHM